MSSTKESPVRSQVSIHYIDDPVKISTAREPFEQERTNYFTEKKKLIGRTVVFSICLGVMLLGKAVGVPDFNYLVINDNLMNWLTPVNDLISTNFFWRDLLQALSSTILDAVFLLTLIPWIFKGKTGRVMYALGGFYAVRSFTQQLIIFPFPAGYYWWSSPGWPSITVPYGIASDFFFSGHVGFLLILSCENFAIGRKWLFWIGIVSQPYLIFILVSYHVHYTSDIIAGLFIAHWMFIMAGKAAPTIDRFFLRLYMSVHDQFSQKGDVSPTTEAESPQQSDDKKLPFI